MKKGMGAMFNPDWLWAEIEAVNSDQKQLDKHNAIMRIMEEYSDIPHVKDAYAELQAYLEMQYICLQGKLYCSTIFLKAAIIAGLEDSQKWIDKSKADGSYKPCNGEKD